MRVVTLRRESIPTPGISSETQEANGKLTGISSSINKEYTS